MGNWIRKWRLILRLQLEIFYALYVFYPFWRLTHRSEYQSLMDRLEESVSNESEGDDA